MTQPSDLHQGLKVLKERFDDPSFLLDQVAINEDALTSYLERTDDIELTRSERLIAFANCFAGRFSWNQICQIYERVLSEDIPGEHSGSFATWTALAEGLLSDGNRSEAERNEIANGLAIILNRALEDTPHNPGFALCLGMHYFREAARQNAGAELIQQSRTWLDRVIEWAGKNDERVCSMAVLYTAHCHAALGEWSRALMLYEAVQSDKLAGKDDAAARAAGIARCKKAIASL